jgi:hypothetical protein
MIRLIITKKLKANQIVELSFIKLKIFQIFRWNIFGVQQMADDEN